VSPLDQSGRVAGIVVAAGRGERFGGATPKALLTLAGKALVSYAVDALRNAGIDQVVVAAPADRIADFEEVVGTHGVVVAGGETRQQSVSRALRRIPAEARWVLVHDAARGLAPPESAVAVLDALRAGAQAVVPGLPLVDTIKSVEADHVTATLDRERLVAVQTPQGFEVGLLREAHRNSTGDASDDAGLVEALGVRVRVVPGAPEAMKITRRIDLALAEAMLAGRG